MRGSCWYILIVLATVTIVGCPKPNPDAPKAAFSGDPLSGPAPLSVQFTDASTAPVGTVDRWFWNFGDGATVEEQNPVHVYTGPGVYSVSLTVGSSGGTDAARKSDYITVTAPAEGEGEGEGEPVAGEVRKFANIAFVWIPAGNFVMGSELSPEQIALTYGGLYRDYQKELPQHKVTFAEGFWMSQYEVTQAEWKVLGGKDYSGFKGDNRPVENMSWVDCHDVIDTLNAKGVGVFRLPSEAEWEYACRAGTTTVFTFGNAAADLVDYAWYYQNSDKKSHDVGLKKPNPWKLYDMYGNVAEWCEDRSHANYIGAPTDGSIWNQAGGAYRMARGGSWYFDVNLARSATRLNYLPDNSYTDVGLRLVRLK
ncbi:MAG: hypothetical protein QG656_146 [Candidatus Hydrogenedentes bacterium]|nr:hypothetical protein [Candidatus Hydrogenedentota bacterium]